MGSGDGGPFHAGEREVQARAGVRAEADEVGRIVRSHLPAGIAGALATFRIGVAASVDAGGDVWASLLTGPAGFLRVLDTERLWIDTVVRPDDPLARRLTTRPELGLLAIDLATRRRIRLNGRGLLDSDHRLVLSVREVYGNCPKYIHPRRIEPELALTGDGAVSRSDGLDARQVQWVSAADTFFIASRHAERGTDASHRGGRPGFVRVHGPRHIEFPDYAGNNMFNTLGNLVVEPRAGLLFLDFERGGVLQLRGRARLEWGADRLAVHFDLDEVVETTGAGVKGRLVEPSPHVP